MPKCKDLFNYTEVVSKMVQTLQTWRENEVDYPSSLSSLDKTNDLSWGAEEAAKEHLSVIAAAAAAVYRTFSTVLAAYKCNCFVP